VIAVDASIAMKLVLNQADSEVARTLWQGWAEAGEVLVAPVLFRAETFSVLRRKVREQVLTEAEGDEAYAVLESLPVHLTEPDGLYRLAWGFARRFNQPTIYDSCYVALADLTGCEFWTADARLAHAVEADLPWVHLLRV
jgi:predicted nucleic acid-binding protein